MVVLLEARIVNIPPPPSAPNLSRPPPLANMRARILGKQYFLVLRVWLSYQGEWMSHGNRSFHKYEDCTTYPQHTRTQKAPDVLLMRPKRGTLNPRPPHWESIETIYILSFNLTNGREPCDARAETSESCSGEYVGGPSFRGPTVFVLV